MALALLPYHLIRQGYKHLYNTAKVLCHLPYLLFDICTDTKAMVGKTVDSIAQFKAVATNCILVSFTATHFQFKNHCHFT